VNKKIHDTILNAQKERVGSENFKNKYFTNNCCLSKKLNRFIKKDISYILRSVKLAIEHWLAILLARPESIKLMCQFFLVGRTVGVYAIDFRLLENHIV
jgi:hypothetical protein